ncbi:MAG: hypothetical protein KAU22_00675 [Desulfuromonadales bacterium]|nr:hypothetical protein [Desulfuromonadales bacterium]
MMIKINARESVEIVSGVFVSVISDSGSKYYSWDELTEKQVECFSGMSDEIKKVYKNYKDCITI